MLVNFIWKRLHCSLLSSNYGFGIANCNTSFLKEFTIAGNSGADVVQSCCNS